MGQYYKTAFVMKDGRIYTMHPHQYENGMKLMEHSWVGNTYVNSVIQQLWVITQREGGCRMAHVGDYSDDVIRDMDGKKGIARKVYNACYGKNKALHVINPVDRIEEDIFIVNDDRKEYIRAIANCDEGKWWIASFMLLIAMGNGLGGGDYRGRNEGLVGRWACDHLRATTVEPTDCLKIHGWEFKEE